MAVFTSLDMLTLVYSSITVYY